LRLRHRRYGPTFPKWTAQPPPLAGILQTERSWAQWRRDSSSRRTLLNGSGASRRGEHRPAGLRRDVRLPPAIGNPRPECSSASGRRQRAEPRHHCLPTSALRRRPRDARPDSRPGRDASPPLGRGKKGRGRSGPPPSFQSRLLGAIRGRGQQVPRPGRGRRGLHQARGGVVCVACGRSQLAVAEDRPDLEKRYACVSKHRGK
jgi:hypothetical protein